MREAQAIFGIDLGQEAKDAAISLWDGLVYYLTLEFVDPYWWWLAVVIILVICITAAELAIRFYFADIPWLRKAGGLFIAGMILMLVGYARGEREAREHDANARPRRRRDEDP